MIKLYKINQINSSEKQAVLVSSSVEVADSFMQRAQGLLGRQSLMMDQIMWIKPCNNIHTFFMKFNIDCIFVDKKNVVQKVFRQVKPYRIVGPVWKAHSVYEAQEGFIDKWDLKVGDQLHVVS